MARVLFRWAVRPPAKREVESRNKPGRLEGRLVEHLIDEAVEDFGLEVAS